MPETSRLARSIEHWREERGLSQSALSEKAGLSATVVNDLLRFPERSPRLAIVEGIARALGLTLWQLLEDPDAPETPPEARPEPRAGIRLLGPDEFAAEERAQLAEIPKALRAAARVAVIEDSEVAGFGLLPGQRLAVLPEPDYAGRLVVVMIPDGALGIRHCAPPWLIAFRPFSVPVRELIAPRMS